MPRGISAKNLSRDKRGQSETRMHKRSCPIKNSSIICNLSLCWLFFSQVYCQYLLATKMKHPKFHLKATTKKPILESFSVHYSRKEMYRLVQKLRMFLFWWFLFMLLITLLRAKWWKFESDMFIDIRIIVEYLLTVVTKKLPQIHEVTGCDSFFLTCCCENLSSLKVSQ